MDTDAVLRIGREALTLVLLLSAPLVLTAMVVGLIVSIVQAATQVQEQTLTFVPKLVGIMVVLSLVGPWIFVQLMTFEAARAHLMKEGATVTS